MQREQLSVEEPVLPKHPMAEAINYALGQWNVLNVFSTDGAVPIDNNVSARDETHCAQPQEPALHGQRAGWKNSRHPGQHNRTCRRLDIDPQLYLTQLLTNQPTLPRAVTSRMLTHRVRQRRDE
jgi:hypothetical protein